MISKKSCLFVGVVLISFLANCLAGGMVGKVAPEITIKQWVGSNGPSAASLKGRVYVVEFWATWCGPCVKQIPHLNELNNTYKPKGVEFISLSQDKVVDKVVKMMKDKKINYNVAIDNGTADWYGITGYPTIFVVGHNGKVAWEGHPWDASFEKAINKAIRLSPLPLLAGVDLGPFKNLKESLRGGTDFAKAYREVESKIKHDSKAGKSKVAKRIIDTIDREISEKIKQADMISSNNPKEAYEIYESLLSSYGGIEATKPAKVAYLQIKSRAIDSL